MARVVALLTAARAAGLILDVEADALMIRGPRTARHLAQALLAAKPAVLSALAREACAAAWARARPDQFRALRARLACGCLRGYGWLVLSDGTRLYDLPGYVRQRLADLDDPRVSAEAARRLRTLLTEIPAIAHQEEPCETL